MQQVSIPKWYEHHFMKFLKSSTFDVYKEKAEEIKKKINDKLANEIEKITHEIGKQYPSVYLCPGHKYVDISTDIDKGYYKIIIDMGERNYPAISSYINLMNTKAKADAYAISKQDAIKFHNGNMAYSRMYINIQNNTECLKKVIKYFWYLETVKNDNIRSYAASNAERVIVRNEKFYFNGYTGTSEEIEFTKKAIEEDIERVRMELENSITKGISRMEEYGGFSSVLKGYEE